MSSPIIHCSAIMCAWTISRKDGNAFKTSYAYKRQVSRNRAFRADVLFSVSEAKPKRKWTSSLAKSKRNSAQSKKPGDTHPSSLFALFCLVLECHYFLDATCMTTATKISCQKRIKDALIFLKRHKAPRKRNDIGSIVLT